MTKLTIEFEPDPEDPTPHRIALDTDEGGRFFVAWIGPTDDIEWTSTDDEYGGGPHFNDLAAVMEQDI